ncbi:unnamed protein product [Leptosia nina]|uniref:Uncharacterized protein n=1 Tax=Leptosia nina TaxID=320188 RepID=A0AAV1J2G1_9NEOP
MNGSIDIPEEDARPLWERLGCGHIARFCRRRRRKVDPDCNNGRNRRDARRRINRPPSAQYSAFGELVRTKTPAGLQCALFCGGSRCKYEQPLQRSSAIQGLYSDWVTEDILAMARPSTTSIAARNIIQQFHSWGIRTVINLQMPGEHASCGPPLTKSGFTYDPEIFMANDIYYYNFSWPDYGEASLSGLLDMAKPVKAKCRCTARLDGKVALVTGGNSGIGLEIARDLAKRGARVIIASRDTQKSAEAVTDIVNSTGNTAVEYRHLDLAKFKSIHKFAEEFNKEEELHVLVNNAGVSGLNYRLTEDGIDMLMQVNFFGPALLTNLLLGKLKASQPSRIVVLTSSIHHDGRINLNNLESRDIHSYYQRYSNSKLCNVLWMKALSKRLPDGVTINSVHPGLVYTDIYKSFSTIQRIAILTSIRLLFKTSEEGAQTCIHLCVSPDLIGKTGGYYVECKERKPSRVARDDNYVEKFWNATMEVIKQ